MRGRAHRGGVVLALAGLASACGQETGEGAIEGFLTVPGCMDAPAGSEACTGQATDDSAVCDSFDLGVR